METVIQGARMRVFTISTSSRTMEQEQRSMAALLSKFRIDFSDVSVIPDIGRKPKAQTYAIVTLVYSIILHCLFFILSYQF